MPKDTLIEVPIRCVNCGYPTQFGAKITAQIICKPKDEIVRKIWKCPNCNCEKTIEIQMPAYEEKKVSRFAIQSQPKKSVELTPGIVQKMDDN